MTTELTLREKAIEAVFECLDSGPMGEAWGTTDIIDILADPLSATGAPAYIRVADDLRGVVREGGGVDFTGNFQTDSLQEARRWAKVEAEAVARYLTQQEEEK